MFSSELVVIDHNKTFTTSLIVANQFKKRHDNITAKIQSGLNNQDAEIKKFSLLNFKERNSIDSRGKPQTIYEITEDGFFELAMGFTGDKAKKIRIRFISEFRKAINEINRLYANPPRTGLIREKRDVHKDMMNALIEHRGDLGKETDAKHFMCENKLCNGVVTGKYAKCNESELSNADLEMLVLVRKRNEAFLMAGIDYQKRKKRLIAFAMKHRTKLISEKPAV